MSFETIKLEHNQQIATLTINRPKALNALNAKVITELSTAFDQVKQNTNIKVLIITGSGDKAFVAGADIKQMQACSAEEALKLSQTGQNVFNQVEDLNIPVIAAVNGFALGGGFELALACDFIIASEKAKFGLPEVTLGLIPGYGGTQRLTRLVGANNARYITFTGDIFSAQFMQEIGAVTLIEEPASVMDKAISVAKTISSRAPKAIEFCKAAILQRETQPTKMGLNLEAQLFSKTFTTEDHNEGIAAFIEKRKPSFKGC